MPLLEIQSSLIQKQQVKEFIIFLICSLKGRDTEIRATYQNQNTDGRGKYFLEQINTKTKTKNKKTGSTFVKHILAQTRRFSVLDK